MSVPYSNTIAQVLDKHLRIRHSNSWQYVEDVRIRHNTHGRMSKKYTSVIVDHGNLFMKVSTSCLTIH